MIDRRVLLRRAFRCAGAVMFAARSLVGQEVVHATAIPTGLTSDDWRSDLRWLADELPRRHPDAFRYTRRDSFGIAVNALDRQIPSLTQEQIIVELIRLVASLRDGHTSLNPMFQEMLAFHRLPARFTVLADGVFIVAADSAHASLVGSRVVRVGSWAIDSVMKSLATLTSAENDMYAHHWSAELLGVPEILHAIGISPAPRSATFEIERDGRRTRIELATNGLSSVEVSHQTGPIRFDSAWVTTTGPGVPVPVYRQAPERLFDAQWLPAARVVYARYDAVRDAPNETATHFAARVERLVDSLPAEKLVFDIRANGGGNDYFNSFLRKMLARSRLNRRGHLFVIIGRNTFSAAQLLVNDLERFTDAIFVGEPTGQRINFFADPVPLVLPKSRIPISVSTLWWQRDSRDTRPWKAPDIFTPVSSADYFAGRDPALAAIVAWTPHT